ncbi:MAG: hypothetical protein U0930_22045 [Pirellulales bacterium]
MSRFSLQNIWQFIRVQTLLALAVGLVHSRSVWAQQEVIAFEGRAIANNPEALKTVRLEILEKHLKSQTSFLKAAIELTAEQSEALSKLDKKWLDEIYQQNPKAAVKKQAGAGGGFLQAIVGGAQPMPQMPGQDNDALIRTLKSEIDKKIKSLISEEQVKQLEAESKSKDEFRAEAMAELTVSLLERQMYLKPEQIENLQKSLNGKINRQAGWHVFLNNRQYLPTIPQKALQEVLNENQLKLIRQMHQNDFLGNEMNIMQMFGGQADEVEVIAEEAVQR